MCLLLSPDEGYPWASPKVSGELCLRERAPILENASDVIAPDTHRGGVPVPHSRVRDRIEFGSEAGERR